MTTPDVDDLHKNRRMFAIWKGAPILGDVGTTEGHAEWFIRMGWIKSPDDPAFESIVRGYTDWRNLYAYRGLSFIGDAVVEEAMERHAVHLCELFNLPLSAHVFAGVLKGEKGRPWPPDRDLGTAQDFKF
jgi:hypothetical protein